MYENYFTGNETRCDPYAMGFNNETEFVQGKCLTEFSRSEI